MAGIGSRRCSNCGIGYPSERATACAVCQGALDYISDPADDDWQEKVRLAQAQPEGDVAVRKVRDWRLAELERAGYDFENARALAGRPDIDLRLAVKLRADGCSQKLAVRILL